VTDSSDSRRPKSSRKKPSREPATLDLKATVIDDGAVQAGPEGGARDTLSDTLGDTLNADVRTPEETIASGSEPPAEDVVASPEASLDSGIGTDTLPSGASVEEPGEEPGEGLG
jgi:hypothetical protein